MTMIARFAALFLVVLFGMTASAQAPRRVALVIGNSAYTAVGPLANPAQDSRLVADALRRAGFTVDLKADLRKPDMERALREFATKADGAEVALVYYAGHGMEVEGRNWLLPVDATLADERALNFEAIDLDAALSAVEGAKGLRVVVLDACRNNPFTRSMRRSPSATRAVTRGLGNIEVTGTLVLYAARAGSLAQDGPSGGNSPFATALARRIPEPGVDIRVLVGKIRDDVLADTNRAQEPFSYGSLPGVELVLVPGRPGASAPAPRPTIAAPQPDPPASSAFANSEWMGDVEWTNGFNPTRDALYRLKPDGTFTVAGSELRGKWAQRGASLVLNYEGERPVQYAGRIEGDAWSGAVTLRDQVIGRFKFQRIR